MNQQGCMWKESHCSAQQFVWFSETIILFWNLIIKAAWGGEEGGFVRSRLNSATFPLSWAGCKVSRLVAVNQRGGCYTQKMSWPDSIQSCLSYQIRQGLPTSTERGRKACKMLNHLKQNNLPLLFSFAFDLWEFLSLYELKTQGCLNIINASGNKPHFANSTGSWIANWHWRLWQGSGGKTGEQWDPPKLVERRGSAASLLSSFPGKLYLLNSSHIQGICVSHHKAPPPQKNPPKVKATPNGEEEIDMHLLQRLFSFHPVFCSSKYKHTSTNITQKATVQNINPSCCSDLRGEAY